MSSNRAIGGARQRRAGEPAPMVGQRSNTSINSQQIFAKQQQMQSQQSNQRQGNPQRQQVQQPNLNSIQENIEQSIPGKLSIPKAFTLVTLRLGRLEQYIQQIQEEGGLSQYNETTSENNQVFDSVIKNVVNRLEELEKELKQVVAISSLKNKDTEREDKNLIDLKINTDKLDKDLRETKDLLMMMMMKHEKFTLETNDKIQNLNDMMIDFMNNNINNNNNYDNNNENYSNEENETDEFIDIISENVKEIEQVIETQYEASENNSLQNDRENIVALNLKEIIENELSSETLGESQ